MFGPTLSILCCSLSSWMVNGWFLGACFKGNFMVRMDFRTSTLHENRYLVHAIDWTGPCLLDTDIHRIVFVGNMPCTQKIMFSNKHSSVYISLLAFPGSVMRHCSPFLTLTPTTGLIYHTFTSLPASQWQPLSRLLWGPIVCSLKYHYYLLCICELHDCLFPFWTLGMSCIELSFAAVAFSSLCS